MPMLASTRARKQSYRQTFRITEKGKEVYRHTLLINPEELSVSEPARINAQQTLGGSYVSHFGQGLFNVVISGTTGFHARRTAEGVMRDGYEELKAFRTQLYRRFVAKPVYQMEMFWYNWEEEEYYKIVPLNFRMSRSKSEPLLYRYELSFTCVSPTGKLAIPKQSGNALDKVEDAIAVTKNMGKWQNIITQALTNAQKKMPANGAAAKKIGTVLEAIKKK